MYYDYVEEFITKLVLNTANKRKGLKQYQDKCRIYLDEYEEQEDLRKEWFEHRNKYEGVLNELDSLLQLAEDFCYFESNQIFANRWMRRN